MPHPVPLPVPLRGQVFTATAARRHGLTPDRLLGPSCRRVLHHVYCDAQLPESPGLLLTAAAAVLPAGGAVAGRWAAFAWGVDLLHRPPRPVEVAVPGASRNLRRQGLVSYRTDLEPGDVVVRRGIPRTAVLRTACDLARREPLHEAVVCLDALLNAHRSLSVTAVDDALSRWPGGRGTGSARTAMRLARRGAESPMETRTRLVLVRGGLPEPELQVEVWDARRLVARLDMAYPRQRVAVEFDGGVHDDPQVNVRDTQRLTDLAALGWTVLRFRAADVYRHPGRVVSLVRAALTAAETRRPV